MAITAVCGTLWIRDSVARALMNAQAVVMAVSAANDFRRFRLPLPLTATGLFIAIVLLATRSLCLADHRAGAGLGGRR